ncbi:NAD-dependent epimerase/dehydratase family protein [Natranaerobius thermophilus]|uniref:NAD-dependent epimerase/dehydratase n=1 Tax=Natranaerobius thermophilus (strain ATCC BAA-1301 / DSM 18059 / JW/NM-WN-LF) TaxID=457570 RepID=B2A0R7_NATTJ|nr:NAD-dependent epimerase/dehydratase family protein [Natranaerobius thermophilus]ACB85947.1 NAD-dependent epimerase/dehydratase [Natranaerobius thermophilus JW/NM-WN-LF]
MSRENKKNNNSQETVLITGGAGFIGSYVAGLLIDQGYRVVIVDDLSTGQTGNIPESAAFYSLCITEDLSSIFLKEKPHYVIHMAAQVSVSKSLEDPEEDAKINLMGGLNLLQEASNNGVEKFVYASTAAVYGDPSELPLKEEHEKKPLSPYGINKLAFEQYLESYRVNLGMDYTVLRYANVYGPRQVPGADGGVVAVFMDRIKKGLPLIIHGDGSQTRDFVYVEDAARANLLALERGSGQVFNVGYGEETSISELVDSLARILGRELPYEYTNRRPGDIYRSVFNSEKARTNLGFQAQHSLESGLIKTVKEEDV